MVCINIVMREGGDIRSFTGGMASQDPVALDCATIDFCEGNHLLTDEQVQRIRSQIAAAESTGIGTGEYEMETVAY